MTDIYLFSDFVIVDNHALFEELEQNHTNDCRARRDTIWARCALFTIHQCVDSTVLYWSTLSTHVPSKDTPDTI